MEAPAIKESRIITELKRGENNPRNSEGDFARLINGDILFAYSHYTGSDAHDDAACNIAGLVSHDNGESFQPLENYLATAGEHGTLNVMSVSLKRLKNGKLCLFYLCKKGPQSELWLKRASENDETLFGKPEKCIGTEKDIYYVINNCRICMLPDGRLIAPLARHKIKTRSDGSRSGEYFGSAQFFVSDENAENWQPLSDEITMPNPGYSGTGLQEPGIIRLNDGTLYSYFRTDRGFHYESMSQDEGRHWSVPVQSRFTGPDSPLLIARNPYSGTYFAFWNPVPNYNGRINPDEKWVNAGRTPFVFAQSKDGKDFSFPSEIENDPLHGYCYPAVMFLSEDEMLLSYCSGGPEDGMCLTKTTIRKLKY